MRNLFLILVLAVSTITAKAQNTFEKKGIVFDVTMYIRKGVEKDILGDYPVIYVDKIDSRVVSANYSLSGKTYTLSSFNGRLQTAFNQVKVIEMRVVGSLADGSMKIDACFEPNSKHGSNITNIKKGTTVNIVHQVMNICEVSGLEQLNSKIRELEEEEKQKQAAKQEEKKTEQQRIPQPQSQQTAYQKSASSNTTSNQSTTQSRPASPTSTTPNYQNQWNNQVAQDKQNMNQNIDNLSNTVSQWAQNKREERLAEQEQKEQREREAYNRKMELLNKINRRKAIVADFPASDIPLGSQEKAATIYYFVYAYESLENEYATVFVSNVFEIGKYADGTRAYTATVKKEIEKLTPYAEVLHGYYVSQEEAEQALADFIGTLKNNDVIVNYLTYKGKPGATNTANNTTENNNSKYEKVIGAPAKIDTRPNNGVVPNKAVDKANNKDEKIIN